MMATDAGQTRRSILGGIFTRGGDIRLGLRRRGVKLVSLPHAAVAVARVPRVVLCVLLSSTTGTALPLTGSYVLRSIFVTL
jgi:hypothetical protein